LIRELVAPALGCPGVLIAVATKVLHRKRRRLVPMLDAVLLRHYLAPTQLRLVAASIEKGPRTLEAFEEAVRKFREDLFSAAGMLEDIRNALMAEGFDLSRVRILEVATWMSKEERGYYR